jgi:hypothetical protein
MHPSRGWFSSPLHACEKTLAEGGLACLPSPAGRLPGAQIMRNDRDWEVNNLEEKSEKRMRE